MTGSSDRDREDGVEFGWRVHAALDSWTGKVDTKASITLAIESAVLGFVITLSKEGERLHDLKDGSATALKIGIACLLIAILWALLVVMPQLRRRRSKREWRGNMIYFGHLRHWEPSDLAAALKGKRTDEKQLAKQLVEMSKIAWRKHARLQRSIVFLMVGLAALVLAYVTS